ncbi:hypothetical protein GGS24DRAFT_92624 [Hypoxylon argillaceum]|nr:hypothetical protein GGS24DRAFT_92624 [Hypoxylon argillaceum]
MEPPSKRLRLDASSYDDDDEEENQDELSMTPAQFDAFQDPMYQLDKGRAKAATRLKSTFEDIFAKYGKDFDDKDGDLINFYTDEIEVDNGHLNSLENRKYGATEDSGSSDEEERIPNRKSSGRGDKSRSKSKSIMPANRTKLTRMPHFQSPWNEPPGLDPYRLSSLNFPSPHGAYPPFDFGRSLYGNSPIDPAWQTPDLPIQLPSYQYGSPTAGGGSPFGPFGVHPHHITKRLVSAKSFLLRPASTSSQVHDHLPEDEEVRDEEDDILLGGDKGAEGLQAHSKGPHKTLIPVDSRPVSYQSSQGPTEQLSFHRTGLLEDGSGNEPANMRKEGVQAKTTEFSTVETASALGQPVDKSSQHHQTRKDQNSSSPTHRKRGRPKKSNTPQFAEALNEESKIEPRLLGPNERRIEIILPMMARLFPTETEQAADSVATMINEDPDKPEIEWSVSIDENVETTPFNGSLHTSNSIGDHGDKVFHRSSPALAENLEDTSLKHTAEIFERLKQPESSKPQDSQSEQTQVLIDLSNTDSRPSDKQHLEPACSKTSQELQPPQTGANNITSDTFLVNAQRIEQKAHCEIESNVIASDQWPSPISPILDAHVVEEQVAHNTSLEGIVKTTLVDQHKSKQVPIELLPQAQNLREGSADGTANIADSAMTEAVDTKIAISPGLESSHCENEDVPSDELDDAPAGSIGEETPPAYRHALNNTTTPRYDTQLEDVFVSLEMPNGHETRVLALEQKVGSRSPEHHSPMCATPKSDQYVDQDHPLPTSDISDIGEDQETDAADQLPLTSVLVPEIDALQLDSDHLDAQRSPSLEATELPDQDLSAFPTGSDAYSTSKLVLRLSTVSTYTTQIDARHDFGTGRSPSPELGTPTGPEIVRRVDSGPKGSLTPTTPTRKRGSRIAKPRSSHHRSPSTKRFPLSSLIPNGIDDESDDELSMVGSFSSATSRLHSPFSRASNNASPDLPPLLSTPRKRTRKNGLLAGSPESIRTPNRIIRFNHRQNIPPATDSRTSRNQARRGQSRAVHSSPLARRVAERLLSSPTKRHRATPTMSPGLVASPHGTLRRCGENGFVCERAFCLTCCN